MRSTGHWKKRITCELISQRTFVIILTLEFGRPGHAFNVLGNVRILQGRVSEAFEHHQNTVDIWLQTYGDEHHKTGDGFHKLGWHFARLGRYDEAV